MHVLVATSETQGQRSDDFCWTVDGELVRFPFDACDTPDCGCGRSFAGLASSRATTTAAVVNHPTIDWARYRQALLDGLARQGFVIPGNREDESFGDDLAREQVEVARLLPAGAVVEINGGMLWVREPVTPLDR